MDSETCIKGNCSASRSRRSTLLDDAALIFGIGDEVARDRAGVAPPALAHRALQILSSRARCELVPQPVLRNAGEQLQIVVLEPPKTVDFAPVSRRMHRCDRFVVSLTDARERTALGGVECGFVLRTPSSTVRFVRLSLVSQKQRFVGSGSDAAPTNLNLAPFLVSRKVSVIVCMSRSRSLHPCRIELTRVPPTYSTRNWIPSERYISGIASFLNRQIATGQYQKLPNFARDARAR